MLNMAVALILLYFVLQFVVVLFLDLSLFFYQKQSEMLDMLVNYFLNVADSHAVPVFVPFPLFPVHV